MREWLHDVMNWSRLPKRYSHDEDVLFRNKPNILFSQITLVAGIAGILQTLHALLQQNYSSALLDLPMIAVVFGAYRLNESGRHLTAKVLQLSFINIFLFIYALVTPPETGIYVFYFPWVAATALIFGKEERSWRISFVSISVSLLLVLFISDFSLLVDWRLPLKAPGASLIVNVIISLLITALFIYFMMRQNEISEQRLRTLTDEIRKKNAELQRGNEQLDRFVYSASHDIKLPIIAIKGLTHLGVIDTLDPKAQLYFAKIERQTDQMGRFLLEMLEYTRNSRTNIRMEQVDLGALVDEVISNLSHLENASRIEFKKYIRIEGLVTVDRVRFMVILNNLVSNAIKYHNYSLANPWVKIMISKVDDMIQVMVADNGLGINDEYKDKVFEMFFHASNSPLGSGLGLFIVKETVEKMKGKIMLSSREGEGACFRIDVPLVA